MGIDYEALGRRIKYYRNLLGFTQEDLLDRLNISQTYLSKIERGKANISVELIVKISNQLGVSVDILLADSVEFIDNSNYKELDVILSEMTDSERAILIDNFKTLSELLKKYR